MEIIDEKLIEKGTDEVRKSPRPKFIKGTKQYKRNAIIDYVLKENLKEYGWSLEPPASKKERKALPELFESI